MDPEALQEEVEEWVSEGIITEEQGERILARYGETEPGRSRAILALSLVGATLVFAGIVLFLASNWEDLHRLARALVLIAGPGLAYLSGIESYRRKAPRVGLAVCLLGAVLVGPSVFLFEELLTVQITEEWLLLVWAAVALPTGHVLRSRVGTLIGLSLLLALVGSLIEPATPFPLVGLLGLVLFVLGHTSRGGVGWVYRVGGVVMVLGGLLGLTTLEGRFDQFTYEPGLPLVAGMVATIGGIGWLYSREATEESVWTATGVLAVGVSTLSSWLAPQQLPPLGGFLGVYLAALLGILGTGYFGYKTRTKEFVDLAVIAALLGTLSFVEATVVQALSGSVALVVAGLVLLAAGSLLERGRRSVLDRL